MARAAVPQYPCQGTQPYQDVVDLNEIAVWGTTDAGVARLGEVPAGFATAGLGLPVQAPDVLRSSAGELETVGSQDEGQQSGHISGTASVLSGSLIECEGFGERLVVSRQYAVMGSGPSSV